VASEFGCVAIYIFPINPAATVGSRQYSVCSLRPERRRRRLIRNKYLPVAAATVATLGDFSAVGLLLEAAAGPKHGRWSLVSGGFKGECRGEGGSPLDIGFRIFPLKWSRPV